MPSFRKLNAAEPAALERLSLSARAQTAKTYDAYLADFTAGDRGRIELLAGEQRAAVRRRLQAAAQRRGLALRFRFGPGPLTFRVEAAPPVRQLSPKAAELTSLAAEAAPSEAPARQPPIVERRAARPARPRQSARQRYHDALPRWMREGQPTQERTQRKRRA